MSLVALTPQNFDTVSIEMHPSRSFSSSSSGITGSLHVYVDRSNIEKDAQFTVTASNSVFGQNPVFDFLASAFDMETEKKAFNAHSTLQKNVQSATETYLNAIAQLAPARRKQQTVEITRRRGTPTFTSASAFASMCRKTLYPYYRSIYPGLNWAYGNYNCLNFFTGSLALAKDTALIYPAPTSTYFAKAPIKGHSLPLGKQVPLTYYPYRPFDKFTFEFYINPRYNSYANSGSYHAGTIMHMSSCYAISLVTASEDVGSQYRFDLDNKPSRFQIMLQLSHSAEILPSQIKLSEPNNNRNFPEDLVFLSSASLKHNHWHHVAIRWGGKHGQERGQGDFIIDGKQNSTFYTGRGKHISGSVMFTTIHGPVVDNNKGANAKKSQPDALFIGNFYDGPNNYLNTAAPPRRDATRNQIAQFFNTDANVDEGTPVFRTTDTNKLDPYTFKFEHPLQAELHEIKIWNVIRSTEDVIKSSQQGLDSFVRRKLDTRKGARVSPLGLPLLDTNQPNATKTDRDPAAAIHSDSKPNPALMFYLPPSFVKQSPTRRILRTPWIETSLHTEGDLTLGNAENTTTTTPFNSELGFRTNVMQINLPNFLREFVLSSYPRLYNLTASVRPRTVAEKALDPGMPPSLKADGFGTQFVSVTDTTPVSFLLGNNQTEKERVNKANMTILPCDNGLFRPNLPALLVTGSFTLKKWDSVFTDNLYYFPTSKNAAGQPTGEPLLSRFVNDSGFLNFGLISLNEIEIIQDSQLSEGLVDDYSVKDKNGSAGWFGPNPTYPLYRVGSSPPAPAVAAQLREKKGDTWSCASQFFSYYNIPNLYYGDRINRGSFKLQGRIGTMKLGANNDWTDQLPITLKDNGAGSLYRADAHTPHPMWNTVGDILYEEGLVIVKSPHIFDLGQLAYATEFQGFRKMHVLEIMIPLPAASFTSSSNPSFKKLLPSDYVSDAESEFVYLTSLNMHDDNFNIIARTNLAQPVIKRMGDKLFFRIKIDF